jgi:23S rRNA pseudouridine2604 synthase
VRLVRAENLFGSAENIPDARASLAPLGRLDQDSRGLLILSEDGVLAKALIGPESQVDKEYVVTVRGHVDRPKIARLRLGLELDGKPLKPAKVKLEDTQVLRFVLKEGRNRQIRRMCELVGLEVADLVRVRVGPVMLGDLPEGKWRHLTKAEREALIAAASHMPSAER